VAFQKETLVGDLPPQAKAAGYKNRIFFDDFLSTDTIDMNHSMTGDFKWYRAQWFFHGNDPLPLADFSVNNSVLTIGSTKNLVTAFDTDPQMPDNFHGTVFGGGGYFEARFKYDPALGGGPNFYGMSIEHIADGSQWNNNDSVSLGHWPGQPPHYGHWIEMDIFETLGNNPTAYHVHLHDWSGYAGSPVDIWNFDNYWCNADLSDPNQFHTYGALWVPQVGTTPGKVEFYFDNVKKQVLYYRGPPGVVPLPGQDTGKWSPDTVAKADRTYSILDSHRLALCLNGPANCPIHVDWVKVWK
jgi:hypothetical protein